MPAGKITKSHFYAARVLRAGTGNAWAVPSPATAPTAGQRVASGQVVGTSTGQVVMLPGQVKGKYFIQVKRPTGELAWVLNSTVVGPVGAAMKSAARKAMQLAPVLYNAAQQVKPDRQASAAAKPARPVRPVNKPRRPAAPATPAVQTGDGQAALQAIIGNDQKTHAWLVKALYYQAQAAKVSGPVGADVQATQLRNLVARYNVRQLKIKQSRLVKWSTGVSSTVQGWVDRLKSLVGMGSPAAVGVLPALPVVPILVGAAVAATLAGALWVLLRDEVPRSAKDLQEAAHLSEIYQQFAPAEKEFYDKGVEDAAKAGRDSVDDSFFGKLKSNALLIGGGLLVFNYLSKKKR